MQDGPPKGETMAEAQSAEPQTSDGRIDSTLTLARLAELGKPLDVRVRALILDNFKSFPRRTRIPIRDGFTTVSGPNGSGKSNLIDALQFVLAVATTKNMRAEKLSDLISYLGTKPRARVALEMECVFKGPNGPVDQVVEVARSVRRRSRGNEIRYELNKNQIRLSDLRDVIRHLGLPVSGQNFVLQNDVIRLTELGGVARRQVLDELAGAKEFDRRIGLAHEELGASDRLTDDTRLILTELGSRLDQLKKERDQALAYEELTSRKHSLEEDLVVLEVTEAEVAVLGKEQAIAETDKARAAADKTRVARQAEADAAKQALDALETELASKGEGERMDAFRGVEALRARLESTRDKAREVTAAQAETAKRRPALETAVGEAEKALRSAEGLCADVAGSLEGKLEQLEVLNAKLEAAGTGMQQGTRDRIEKAERIRELRQESEALRAEEARLVARDRELAERASRGEAERALLAGTVAEQGERREAMHQDSVAAAQAFRERREESGQLEERRRRLIQQVQGLRSGLESIASKVSRAQQEVAAAEAMREQAHTMGGGRALSALTDARLGGVHGPVANLVDFEPRYAEALEAAAGGRLNYVVVDDEHVASRAIALLKRTRAGRLSFAPLSKVRPRKAPGPKPRGNAVVGFAIDLVAADRRYDAVLSTVFGDTLVVETLEDAKPLIGQYRMVTLDGDLVEKNAIMSGGSRGGRGGLLAAAAKAMEMAGEKRRALQELDKQQQAARAKLAEAEAELSTVSEEAATQRAQLAECEARSRNLAGELGRLEESLAPKADRLEKLEVELQAIKAEQGTLEPRLIEVRTRLQAAQAEVEILDDPEAFKAYEAQQQQMAEVEAQLIPLRKEVQRLRQEESEANTARGTAEVRLEAAKKALAEAEARGQELTAQLAELEARVESLAAELTQQEQALAELSAELADLTRRRNEAREAAQVARDKAREAAREVEHLGERLSELARELEELRRKAVALREAAEEREIEVPGPEEAPADLERERKRISKTLHEVDQKISKMGPVNHLAIEQYDTTVTRHEELEKKIEVLEEEKREIRERIVDLEGRKRIAFLEAFERVRVAFADTYQELGRGEGHLILEDPKDPFAGGLLIKVRPRGKKLGRLESLSGGERALTALALIFALQEVNPAPLFVFDEVDKDLDAVNTKILAEAIRKRADERQYVVISHHRCLLERSHQTIGVTQRKGFGTQVTGIEIDDILADEEEDELAAETAGAGVTAGNGEAAQ